MCKADASKLHVRKEFLLGINFRPMYAKYQCTKIKAPLLNCNIIDWPKPEVIECVVVHCVQMLETWLSLILILILILEILLE